MHIAFMYGHKMHIYVTINMSKIWILSYRAVTHLKIFSEPEIKIRLGVMKSGWKDKGID